MEIRAILKKAFGQRNSEIEAGFGYLRELGLNVSRIRRARAVSGTKIEIQVRFLNSVSTQIITAHPKMICNVLAAINSYQNQ